MSTLPNDGTVADDPCHLCQKGRLLLKRMPHGGWILVCDQFRVHGCLFKMAANNEMIHAALKAASERREARKLKQEAKLALERDEMAEERRRKALSRPRACEECFMTMSEARRQQGKKFCANHKHMERKEVTA